MITPVIFADTETESEFWGRRAQEVETGKERPVIVHVSPSLRGICLGTAIELNRIFGVITIYTSCIRTLEEEDAIYPARVEAYGALWQPGKPFGPHPWGRGIDWTLAGGTPDVLKKAYEAGKSYQNRYFPYGYNAPSRLIRAGKIKPLPYETCILHDVGRGYHAHSQESWRD